MTPTNAIKINSQITLIVKRIREHKSSSPNLIIKIVLQVKRGSIKREHLHTLLKARVAKLKQANKAASKRKKRKKKQIQEGRTLSQVETEELLRKKDAKAKAKGEGAQVGSSSKAKRYYKTCSKTGHNKRTYLKDKVEIED
jgi:hypothetical protein